MNTAKYVDELISVLIKKIESKDIPKSEAAWQLALACELWAYVFGAYGEYCDPTNRRSRASADHPKIKANCKNFGGRDDIPAGCVGCKWFLGTADSDESKHEGRTRFFDCRGFVYYVLHKLFGMWDKCPAGATTMWKTESNWAQKGKVKSGVPKDVLVCLFYPEADDPKKMAHIGFGYNGKTVECSKGVEYHEKYNAKWTDWAIPKCVVDGSIAKPEEPASTGKPIVTYPTIRRGDKGDAVVELQSLLSKVGSTLQIDGIFGTGTASAVRAFQTKNGLEVDGVVGPKTWTKLLEAAGNIQIPEPSGDENPFRDDMLHTLIIPNLTHEEALALTRQYPGAVPVDFDEVSDLF